ncbi:oxidoreductase [Ancrocorticia populi]|uniref:oxidoreductase n=1 Tax=Ancrocorticia populi TaxID=2175228 RepID=UPI003F999494
MSGNYDRILEPVQFGSLTLKNRVIMLPMHDHMATPEGFFSDRQIAYFKARAEGGTALILTGATAVSEDYAEPGEGWNSVASDAAIPSMKKLADEIHAVGGKIAIQLTAGLGRNGGDNKPGEPPVSASANQAFGAPGVTCLALTTSEVKTIVRRFGEAATRCVKADIDAVDIHGHTGYLIDQFLSPQWNTRTDEYGGSAENRARFACEIISEIKRVAPDLPVRFRLSLSQRFPDGRTTEDGLELARYIEAAGLDVFLADDGCYEAMDYVFPPYYLGDGCMVPAARTLKDSVSIPVVACGNLDPDTAAEVLEGGDADIIGVGRGLIADPQWVDKLAKGRRNSIRPCIRCNATCVGNVLQGEHLACAVNPEAGFELEREIQKAPSSTTVTIVGAGPAGLEAARVASSKGNTVDIYDSADRVGGVLLPAATAVFKKKLHRMIDWWEGEIAALPVTVHLGYRVTADDPIIGQAANLIVATGSDPIVPPSIPGIDGPNVTGVIEAHEGARLGHRVVVAGGGLSGADLALELAQAGHAVTIVEMMDSIARDMLPTNQITLLRELAAADVEILTGHKVTEIHPDGVVVIGPHEVPKTLLADTVVTAFGVKAADELGTELKRHGVPYTAIGDCTQPAKVGEAINAGYAAALAI